MENDYIQLDYSGGWLPENTKIGMYHLFKESNTIKITEFLTWLETAHPQFMFNHVDFIFTRLVEFKYFSLADELFSKNSYYFNERIAKSCAFNICLNFNIEPFDYLITKVINLNIHEQTNVFKSFWNDFLNFQFTYPNEINDNLPNLKHVFDKVPFYLDNDISNGYLINSRKKVFQNKINNLENDKKNQILTELGILCAIHYPEYRELIIEEFENHPQLLNIFDTHVFNNKLENSLINKKINNKIKI